MKIAPAYSGPVVHVLDASRAVGVAGALVDAGRREGYAAEIRDRVRGGPARACRAASRRSAASRSPRRARTGARSTGRPWTPPRPSFLGVRAFERTRSTSSSSGSTGRRSSRPGSCAAPTRRSSTTRRSARPPATCTTTPSALLERIVADERLLRRRGVVGFWPANATPTTTSSLWRDEARTEPLATFHTLRQQMAKPDGRPNVALADFVAPVSTGRGRPHRGIRRHRRPRPRRTDGWSPAFEAANDDYSAILAKALADRLAEAFAERLHERVRRELWGYAPDEALDQRRPHRRALPGHPARRPATRPARTTPRSGRSSSCSTRRSGSGIQLTESMAMLPGASVSGLYLWHPDEPLLRDRADRARPARGLRAPQGRARRRGRALARPEPADDA